jgi:hypothetical protein
MQLNRINQAMTKIYWGTLQKIIRKILEALNLEKKDEVKAFDECKILMMILPKDVQEEVNKEIYDTITEAMKVSYKQYDEKRLELVDDLIQQIDDAQISLNTQRKIKKEYAKQFFIAIIKSLENHGYLERVKETK